MIYIISKLDKKICGRIRLDGSKSISNRVLTINALSESNASINHIAYAKDTQTLLHLLKNDAKTLDAGPAGTTFRFMTAYLALRPQTQILTGSERMKQRPIGILVENLNQLGANIEYLEKKGYPPLKINPPLGLKSNVSLQIPANVSSQFISALLMIAPTLPGGLRLELTGKIVSRPYIEMTLRIMQYFGVQHRWEEQTISIEEQSYQQREFDVEADWSAASYYYAIAAFAEEVDLYLDGLHRESLQGDAAIQDIMTFFGVQTEFTDTGIRLTKTSRQKGVFKYNFLNCPDIAQTLAVVCAGLGYEAELSGLKTLRIKETDRIQAVIDELQKVGILAETIPDGLKIASQDITTTRIPRFETYHDHRMAMAFTPLALLLENIQIESPMVVDKSYPAFWQDMERLGFAAALFMKH